MIAGWKVWAPAGRFAIRVRVQFTPVRRPLFPGHPIPELAWKRDPIHGLLFRYAGVNDSLIIYPDAQGPGPWPREPSFDANAVAKIGRPQTDHHILSGIEIIEFSKSELVGHAAELLGDSPS
jgi:hypothetical protein